MFLLNFYIKMRQLYINILALLFPVLLFSQEESIFWKIEKDSITSYLLGTLHLFGGSFIEKNDAIISALKSSRLIVTENIGSANAVFEKRNSFNYIEKLSSKEKNKLLEILNNKTNVNKLTIKELLGQTDRYWGRFSCLDDDERKDTLLIDDYIKKYAERNKINNEGLETLEETLESVEIYTYPNFSEKKLLSVLKDKLDKFSENLINKNCFLENAYRNKKIHFDFDKNIDIPILTARNKNWIIKIPTLLKENKNIFIAVGIGHLNFKNGLIEQLKSLGYKVTPINLL